MTEGSGTGRGDSDGAVPDKAGSLLYRGMLIREIDHRVHNLLQCLQSVFSAMQEESKFQIRGRAIMMLEERIFMVSRIHDLLINCSLEGMYRLPDFLSKYSPFLVQTMNQYLDHRVTYGFSIQDLDSRFTYESSLIIGLVIHEMTRMAPEILGLAALSSAFSFMLGLESGEDDNPCVFIAVSGFGRFRAAVGESDLREEMRFAERLARHIGGTIAYSAYNTGFRCSLSISNKLDFGMPK